MTPAELNDIQQKNNKSPLKIKRCAGAGFSIVINGKQFAVIDKQTNRVKLLSANEVNFFVDPYKDIFDLLAHISELETTKQQLLIALQEQNVKHTQQ